MITVQMTLDENLVKAVDRISKQLHTNRSAFTRKALREALDRLSLEQLDAPLVLAFLEHIETIRGNSARTRNARLAAIKAFAHFIEYRVPSAIEQVR